MRHRYALPTLSLVAFAGAANGQTLVPNDLELTVVVRQLPLPIGAEFLPDGRMVVIGQNGALRVVPAGGGTPINAGTIQIEGGAPTERGLLGLAVDPMFATTNRLYFYYSAPGSPTNDRHRVAYTTIDPQTSMIDTGALAANEILSGLYGPNNHNGGGIKFGPDGHLYVGVGDTGCNCSCAPGQADNYFPTCLTNLNGKILRIDREGGIPATNPLTGAGMVPACGNAVRPCGQGPNVDPLNNGTAAARSEIYLWGFRNPWRFSFDEQTGFLWIGDVGEVTFEEINVATGPGQHFGWPFREGAQGDDVATCAQYTPQSGNCKEPAFAYPHGGGAGSVSGGVFANSCIWPAAWSGRYFFSDYTNDIRRVWSISPANVNGQARDGADPNSLNEVITNAPGVVHFFNGPDGAIYMVNILDGEIWRLAPTSPIACLPDGGVPVDAGVGADVEPNPDAPPGPNDAVTPIDADNVGPDAGAPRPDANAPGADAAAPGADAQAGDGGGADTDDGCGCKSSGRGAGSASWIALAALLLLGRRRRQA
jgi:glucose/arabinose dehydrogenase